jgi:hypothetical protein
VDETVTTANARIGPAILDGAFPFASAFSSRKTAVALVRARLTWSKHEASGLFTRQKK